MPGNRMGVEMWQDPIDSLEVSDFRPATPDQMTCE
jgi:hypothetical protein